MIDEGHEGDAALDHARSLLTLGKAGEAEAVARRVLLLDPYSKPGNLVLAYALIAQNRGADARAAAQRALALNRDDVDAQVALAVGWLADRRPEEAELAARTAIAMDPTVANAHAVLGHALQDRKVTEEAERELETAVRLDPDNDPAGERLWFAWRAPLLGALSFAAVMAMDLVRVLVFGGRLSERVVLVGLLLMASVLVAAVLVGLWRQRRRLARVSPYTRVVIEFQARHRRWETVREVLPSLVVLTVVIVSLSALAAIFTVGARATLHLGVGDCVTTDKRQSIDRVSVVPCLLPHDLEVFAVLADPSPPGAPYPGLDAVHAAARPRCTALYEAYVGRPYDESATAWVRTWVPEESYWILDIRSLYCMLADPSGHQLVGSLRDTP